MINYEESPVFFDGVRLDVKVRNGTTFWEGEWGTPGYEPVSDWFGMSPAWLMIPPRKPNRMALIGTFNNAIGRLTKQIHADWDGQSETIKPAEFELDMVDTHPVIPGVHQSTGLDFLKSKPHNHYDFMAVDAYKLGTLEIGEGILTAEFAEAAKAASHWCIHLLRVPHLPVSVDYWPELKVFEKDWRLQSYKIWRNHFVPLFTRKKP